MSYLCGMKTTKLITLTAFVFWLSLPLHAQFNTIGTIGNKRINTTNPPKSHQALTDSIVVADSISESKSTNIEGGGQTIDSSMSNHDLMSLVALPLKKIHVSSGFGMRMHPIYHKRILHNGIDLSARYENVYSMFPGTVIRVGQDNRSGKFVTVRTGDYTISYCHLSQPFVQENDYVNAGMSIAISGNTGASTGPHLHITAKKDDHAFNAAILLEYIMRLRM
jgi:murein DD-endopeptidase MepM/ murein hydrolase activator NlpD